MPYFNQTIYVGHAGSDAKSQVGKDGISTYTKFSLAYSDKVNGQDKTTWINCVAFGKTGEYCLGKVKKGDTIQVIGRLNIDAYNRKQDNVAQVSANLTVEKMVWFKSSGQTAQQEIPTFNSTVPSQVTDDLDVPF